jgi:predicted signal transduction protein with EAL and GGDEF domain
VTGEEDAVQVATRVLEALEGEPIRLKDHEVKLSASIGIAVSTGDDHPESLLREADAAMYRAKEQGRSRFELFDDAMRTRTKRRVELSDQLAQGLERGEIVPYFQPTVDLNTGRVAGLEALARWLHPTRGILTPTEFIVIAEETGLVSQLGMSMLTQALAEARRWHDRFGAAAPVVHVNISPRQLSTSSLVQRVADELRKAGVPASGLCLEITENALMDDVNHAVTVLGNLKDIGVQLAVDDFGTGYSSLSYLRRFPVDVLKVDRSFVDGLGPDPEDSAIVAAVVKLAHTLELRAVAEGVETEDQLARLQLLGCDEAQGYLFSPARPADEILSQLEEWVVRPKRDRV